MSRFQNKKTAQIVFMTIPQRALQGYYRLDMYNSAHAGFSHPTN